MDAQANSRTDTSAVYLTAPVYALDSKSLSTDEAVTPAVGKYLFRTWGPVVVSDSNNFKIGQSAVKVYCPSHGLTTGDFASACGMGTRIRPP